MKREGCLVKKILLEEAAKMQELASSEVRLKAPLRFLSQAGQLKCKFYEAVKAAVLNRGKLLESSYKPLGTKMFFRTSRGKSNMQIKRLYKDEWSHM